MSDDVEQLDPLRNADVGEIKTVRESVTMHTCNFEPMVFYGSDRMGRSEVVDIEIVEDEYGDEEIIVTFEADLTKRLPRNWDTAREPRTETEAKEQRRARWRNALFGLVGALIPAGLATAVAFKVMEGLAGQSIEFQSTMQPTLEVFILVGLVLALTIWIIGQIPASRGRLA